MNVWPSSLPPIIRKPQFRLEFSRFKVKLWIVFPILVKWRNWNSLTTTLACLTGCVTLRKMRCLHSKLQQEKKKRFHETSSNSNLLNYRLICNKDFENRPDLIDLMTLKKLTAAYIWVRLTLQLQNILCNMNFSWMCFVNTIFWKVKI